MSNAYEVPEPILNSPYAEPAEHWWRRDGEPPEKRTGRRAAGYWYAAPGASAVPDSAAGERPGTFVELPLVNEIRKRIAGWRNDALAGGGGVSRTTCDLMNHWHNPDRPRKLFFAQLEAAETIIFLTEARADLLQGITVPPDEPGDSNLTAFRRYACKMATGSGKTTVMGLLAAWSILNKVADLSDGRFSDTVLVVCPNVTIRNRLAELDPARGSASLYRTRDLVPVHQMADLAKGKVVVTNWHAFEPQLIQTGGVSARVSKAGRKVDDPYWVRIGPKTTSARGKRYLSFDDYRRQRDLGQLDVVEEKADAEGNLVQARIRSEKYVESDTALLNRVLGREVGGKQNILVFNDEAHHAYRIRREEPDEDEGDLYGDDEEAEDFFKEATVWVDGLDRIHKGRGINFCVDLSATPYYLGRVGQDTNRTFP
jgi:type III restriction enzyme